MKISNFFTLVVFSFLITTTFVFASTSDGTIDATYRYAWGENVGFVDFGSTEGNIHITDTTLSGYAYGENIGFINLTNITNNNEGDLSGYAWGENVGFIDFSNTKIGTDGVFTGYAYGENIGFITFGTENNKVSTDWRPKSTRRTHSQGGSSGSIPVISKEIVNPTIPTTCLTLNITRTLKLTTPRTNGDDVKSLQTYLNCHKYITPELVVDGVFGSLTRQAVIKFQLANNLKGDGIVGPLTRSKLK